eukprot:COSAG06_NODE_1671_length_8750_cov_2.697145_5_plen_1380_part_00
MNGHYTRSLTFKQALPIVEMRPCRMVWRRVSLETQLSDEKIVGTGPVYNDVLTQTLRSYTLGERSNMGIGLSRTVAAAPSKEAIKTQRQEKLKRMCMTAVQAGNFDLVVALIEQENALRFKDQNLAIETDPERDGAGGGTSGSSDSSDSSDYSSDGDDGLTESSSAGSSKWSFAEETKRVRRQQRSVRKMNRKRKSSRYKVNPTDETRRGVQRSRSVFRGSFSLVSNQVNMIAKKARGTREKGLEEAGGLSGTTFCGSIAQVVYTTLYNLLCPSSTEQVRQLESHLQINSLHNLITKGERQRLKEELARDPRRLWERDGGGTTPILWAYRKEDIVLGRELIETYANAHDPQDPRYTGNKTPVALAKNTGVEFRGMNVLHTSIVSKHYTESKWLIENYPKLLAGRTTGGFFDRQKRRYFGETPLMFAVATGQANIVRLILDKVEEKGLTGLGTSLLEVDRYGNTVLHISVLWDDLEMYQFLLAESDRRMKRQQLKLRFSYYDADGSNYLDASEVQLLCDTDLGTDTMDVGDVMQEIDIDNNGSVTFEEFFRWYDSADSRASIIFQQKYQMLCDQVRLQGMDSVLDEPQHMQLILNRKLELLRWTTQTNNDALSPLTLAAKQGNQKFFVFINEQASITSWEYSSFLEKIYLLDGVDVPHGLDFSVRSRSKRAHMAKKGYSALFHICMQGNLGMITPELRNVLETKWLKFGRSAFWMRNLVNLVFMLVFSKWTLMEHSPRTWECCANSTMSVTGVANDHDAADMRQTDLRLMIVVWLLLSRMLLTCGLHGNGYWRIIIPAHVNRLFRDGEAQGCIGTNWDEQTFFFVFCFIALSSYFWLANYLATDGGEMCPVSHEEWTAWQWNAVRMHWVRSVAVWFGWVGWGFYCLLGASKSTGVMVMIIVRMMKTDVFVFLTVFAVICIGFFHHLFLTNLTQHAWLSPERAPEAHNLPAAEHEDPFSEKTICTVEEVLNVSKFAASVVYAGFIASDDHTGIEGDGNTSATIMFSSEVLFAVMLPVILLNLLIAQMAHTFDDVFDNLAEKFELERAAIMHGLENQLTVNQFNARRRRYTAEYGNQAWAMVTTKNAKKPGSAAADRSSFTERSLAVGSNLHAADSFRSQQTVDSGGSFLSNLKSDSFVNAMLSPSDLAALGKSLSPQQRARSISKSSSQRRHVRPRLKALSGITMGKSHVAALEELDRELKKRKMAVVTIQAIWRGKVVRKMYKQNKACIRIQACTRGLLFRKQLREQTRKCCIIQRRWRLVARRRMFKKELQSTLVIQRNWKSYRKMHGLQRQEDASEIWSKQTIYIAGIMEAHASVRVIRSVLRNVSDANIASVNVRKRQHKTSWALATFGTLAEASYCRRMYHSKSRDHGGAKNGIFF